MSHLNLDRSTDTWHVVLVYLATNGQLIETANILGIDKSKASYRLGLAGVITRQSCSPIMLARHCDSFARSKCDLIGS